MSENTIFAVAVNSDEYMKLMLSENKNCLCIGKTPCCIVMSDGQTIHPISSLMVDSLNENDVVKVVNLANLYKVYDACSSDNAIVVTEHCNSNCIMCPYSENYRKQKEKISYDDLWNFIDYIPADTEFLTITGGEPTLIGENIIKLMSKLKERLLHTQFQFLTNGRIFSNEEFTRTFLDNSPHRMKFCVPLYGGNAEKHDFITQTAGSFEQAVIGIKRLLRFGQTVEIRIVVSKLNCNDLENIADFINEHLKGLFVVNFMGLEMCGAAAVNRDRVWIDYKSSFEYMKAAIDRLITNGNNVVIYNYPLCAVDKPYRSLCHKSISGYKVTFSEECETCKVKEICGGFFNSSFILEKPNGEAIYD